MRFKTWPVAALGLLGLLALTVVSIVASSRRAQEIYTRLDELNTLHRKLDGTLQDLRLDIRRTEVVARDYLLDLERGRFVQEPDLVTDYRNRLGTLRENNHTAMDVLGSLSPERDRERIIRLRARVDDYWQAFQPVFGLSPEMVRQGQTRFLRRAMDPRRDAILAIAREIQEINDANLAAQRESVARRQALFRSDARRLLAQSVGLGLIVALVAVFRLRTLERRSEEQRAMSERAEQQTRQLSQQLVAAQEEERKHLSRELHDHVAQVLTALRMELSRIERIRSTTDLRVGAAVAECKTLVDKMFRTVRDLTLGLRPTMLDDFGLQPALEWQVRDVMQRCSIRVDLQTSGDLESLPDRYRTCVFRVVQEALTNCVRHAQAESVRVSVTRTEHSLDVAVVDDGIGFDPNKRMGLGLRGIEERVKELQGVVSITSSRQHGTTILLRLPLGLDVPVPDALARIAG